MSRWALDPSLIISDLDETDLHRSILSARFCVPHHPAGQGIVQKWEDIDSTLRGHGVSNDSTRDLSFDYIVVGGGTAGLALASRLAENLQPGQYVCVVESGIYRQDALVDVPGMYGVSIGQPDYDWCYKTVPQPNLDNRSIPSSAGRVLGGSSAINFLVRLRGSRPEYDAWNEFGSGWNWESLLQYFKSEECYEAYEWGTNQIFPGITREQDEKAREKEPAFRGHFGPVHSTHNTVYTDLLKPTIEATLAHGIKTNRTPGYGDSTGMFNIDTAVDRRKGVRSYAANTYLQDPASTMPQPNMIVLKGVYATKILFDSNCPKAVGLACVGGVNWKLANSPVFPFNLRINKEIIVSGGTYNTPRLLELSGIGNPEIPTRFNIRPVVNIPTVGENLQEHPYVVSDFVVKDGVFTFDRLRNDPAYKAEQEQQYRDHKTGAYVTTVSAYGFIKLRNFLTEEEVQELKENLDEEFSRTGNAFHKKQLEIQKQFLEHDGVGDMELIMVEKAFATNPPGENKSYISLLVSLPHPVARGSVHISSPDPLAAPSIDPCYLNNTYDTKILTKATKFVRKLSETEPLRSIIVAPSTPGPEVQTEAQFEEFVRSHVKSVQHPIGTASMAPALLGGVVDNNLRVYGTENVRVVDMSIAPLHLAAHLVDTAYAIGEKGAALMKAEMKPDHSI